MTRALKNYVKHTEPELIHLWKQGDEQVFEVFYHKHALKLLHIAVNKTGDKDVAEELVQDAFMSLYRHKQDITQETHLGAYLYVSLKNNILNHYRKESTHKRYESFIQQTTSEADYATETAINTRELELLIIEEIEKLPPQCKAVFKLSRFEYLSDKDIAARLDISVNTVEQHKRKALKILRGAFKNYLSIAIIMHLLR